MLKSKTKKLLLGILLCICAAFFALPLLVTKKAYGYLTLPTGDNAIGNIYMNNGKFDKDNLDLLAQKAGYSSLDEMVTEAENGEIKTSADFGETIVNFGSYTFGGTTHELTWIPAYLSNSDDGPILTLWLSHTENVNGTLSNQEVSSFSDGTYSNTASKTWNGSTVYSDTYDSSYMHNYVLNGSSNYVTAWDLSSELPPPEANTMTKFSQFTGSGALANYIVKPNAVSWQKTADKMKNDPAWNASGASGTGANYPSAWLNDNLWLPSMYEIYDHTLAANTATTTFSVNGGLWHMGDGSNRQKWTNSIFYWLRSGYATRYDYVYAINYNSQCTYGAAGSVGAVRPALHLNLSLAAENAISSHVHSMAKVEAKAPGCTTVGNKEYWHCTGCDKYFSDEGGENVIELSDTVIEATDHQFAEEWKTDDDNHWHECKDCGTVEPNSTAAHSGGTANCQQKATCEVCGQTYGELGGHVLEHHEAKTPSCTEIGWNAYDTCKLCDYTTYSELAKIQHTPGDWITDDNPTCTETGSKHKECTVCHTTLQTETISATGHDYSDEWETDGSNHWHICANECGIKGDNAVHTFAWIVDKAASFTETGLRHEECTVCHLKRNENTEIPLVTCLHENTTHHDKVPATCVEKGTVEYKYCSDCQKNLDMSDVELSDLEIPIDPNNHAWGEWQIEAEATCAEKGTEKRVCADCNHEETRDIAIDPTAHDIEHHEAKAATCTEIGWNEYDECSRCDYTTYSEIPSKGHDFSITVSGTPPTCQEGGTATMKCSRCEQTQEQNSADPVDHVYTNYVSNGNATCTANGTKTAECDFGCGATDTIEDEGSATGHTPGEEAACTTPQTCTVCNTELAPALGHDWSTEWSKDETNHWHICSRCDELNENTSHTYEWVITKEATVEEPGLMENICTACGDKDGEEEIAKLIDPNGEIDLPVDINVEFKVTQSSTGNNYSEIDKSLKLGYWAQLWYRNDDGTLGDEFTDTINCFLTLKIPTDIIEAIRGGEEINRDKIAAGLKVYYIDGEGTPVEVENFTIAMRDDDSWQIKFNYNEKFRAEVVFAADLDEPVPEPETSGIPWWVWLIVGIGVIVVITLIVVIAIAAKNKKNGNGNPPIDNGEVLQRLDNQDQVLNELLNRGDDGGFNTPVELDENGNVIFK